tara:strand:+ start:635 stop:778 length:144 start_codon:yes stop_codon:yes gene_type:complete
MPLLVIPVGLYGYQVDLKRIKADKENIDDYDWDFYLRAERAKTPNLL